MYERVVTVFLLLVFIYLGALGDLAGQDISKRLAGHVHFYEPPGEAVHPAVLAVPGCSGVSLEPPDTDRGGGSPTDSLFRRHYPEVAAELADSGYVVALLDYLGAEGVVNACRGEVPISRVGEYARAAFDVLRSHPQVDQSRMYVVGWSLGGSAVLAALAAGFDQALVAGIALLYPGCQAASAWPGDVRVHLFAGGTDDITLASECEAFVTELDRPSVRLTVYRHARHGFDVPAAPSVIGTGRGTTVGYDPDAAVAAWSSIHDLFSKRP
jgi:dienelactone hydrolase